MHRAVRGQYRDEHRPKCSERRPHARDVYPTQDTSRMATARGRSRYTNQSKRAVRNMEEKNVGTIRRKIPNKA